MAGERKAAVRGPWLASRLADEELGADTIPSEASGHTGGNLPLGATSDYEWRGPGPSAEAAEQPNCSENNDWRRSGGY
jgi:hypothetical protein